MKRTWKETAKAYPKKAKHSKMKPYNRKEYESDRYNRANS